MLFGDALAHLVEGYVEASQETEFGVRGCQVVDGAKAVLICDIGGLDACFFAYFAADGAKGAWLLGVSAVEVAFEEAANDVVAANVDIHSLPLVKQNIAVAGLDD